jgi:uncharacterized SAM-binding protein YcdF (DUF218 family)
MKEKIALFIEYLIPYDYVLFGISFILFFLLVVLGILLRKHTFFALIFIILGFSVLLVAPTLGYVKLHEFLFKNSLVLLSQKRLEFTQAVVVKGSITNESKKPFAECKITASAYKVTSNKYKNYLKKLKPFQKMSIVLNNIAVSETQNFKIIIEPFTYQYDYNISLGADCR